MSVKLSKAKLSLKSNFGRLKTNFFKSPQTISVKMFPKNPFWMNLLRKDREAGILPESSAWKNMETSNSMKDHYPREEAHPVFFFNSRRGIS